jgi:hypothetical protein
MRLKTTFQVTFEKVSCCPSIDVPSRIIKSSIGKVNDFKLHDNGELLCDVNLFFLGILMHLE